MKEKPQDLGLKAYGDNSGKGKNEIHHSIGLTLQEAFKTPSFYFVLISTLGLVICLASSIFYIPSFLTDTGIDPIIVGTILSVLYTLNALGKLFMGKINDILGIKTCIFYGGILFVISMGITFYITSPFVAFIFAIIYGLSNPVASFPITILTSEIFGEKYYSNILPIMQATASIGSALATPIIGTVYDKFGSYNLIFIIFIFLAIVSLVITQLAYKFRPNFKNI
ncbi:MAG: MFS transporter [Eubacteriaceae bacterium]